MDELMQKLQSILSTPEGQAQLNNIAGMLNNQPSNQSQSATPPPQQPMDFNAILSSLMQPQPQNNPPPQQNPNPQPQFDLNGLLSQLGGGNQSDNSAPQFDLNGLLSQLGGGNQSDNSAPQFDLNGLLSQLGGGNQSDNSAQMPNIDIGMIMNLQNIFSQFGQQDKNTMLLNALKPHFSEERQKKVDKAIMLMRVLQIMPALKDSGILGGFLDKLS